MRPSSRTRMMVPASHPSLSSRARAAGTFGSSRMAALESRWRSILSVVAERAFVLAITFVEWWSCAEKHSTGSVAARKPRSPSRTRSSLSFFNSCSGGARFPPVASNHGDQRDSWAAEEAEPVSGILQVRALHCQRFGTLARRSGVADVRWSLAAVHHDYLSRDGVRVAQIVSSLRHRQAQPRIRPAHLPPFL